MYTEFHFNCKLREDISNEVIKLLEYMITDHEIPSTLPDHPLFSTERWLYMLRTSSYYFDADTHSTIRLDKIDNKYHLCIRCNLKNYDEEIEKFIDWIRPYLYCYDEQFLGFYRCEEDSWPTLIMTSYGSSRYDETYVRVNTVEVKRARS